jgi:phosphate transport system protein
MKGDRVSNLASLEKRARRVHEVTLELLRKTHELVCSEDVEEREKLIKDVEDGVALLDVLKRDVTEALLAYAVRYQPLGNDFRRVHALLDVLYDMFRIGRYCREIALTDKYVSRLSDESLKDLRELTELSIRAYEKAFEAFFEGCRECVDVVKEIDEKVDKLYVDFLKEIGSMRVVESKIVAKTLALRHIERIVDHSVSIAMGFSSYV